MDVSRLNISHWVILDIDVSHLDLSPLDVSIPDILLRTFWSWKFSNKTFRTCHYGHERLADEQFRPCRFAFIHYRIETQDIRIWTFRIWTVRNWSFENRTFRTGKYRPKRFAQTWMFCVWTIWATSWENLFMPYAKNKGADQSAHPRSLISAFVVRCLDSIIPLVSLSEISGLYLAFVVEQASLSLPWSQTPNTGFLVTWLISKEIRYERNYFWTYFPKCFSTCMNKSPGAKRSGAKCPYSNVSAHIFKVPNGPDANRSDENFHDAKSQVANFQGPVGTVAKRLGPNL